MMIRIFGAACAALLILAAVAVASPEAAEAQDVALVSNANVADIDNGSDVVLAPIVPPKTEDELKSEKEKYRDTIKTSGETIDSLEERWELLLKLLKMESFSDVVKDLGRPDAKGNYDEEWRKKVDKWWETLTKEQKQRFQDARVRKNEIKGLIRDLENREAYEKRKADLENSKTSAEENLKDHCEKFPAKEGEF